MNADETSAEVPEHAEDRTEFQLSAEGVELHFAGTEAFVEKQLTRFRPFLESAIGVVPPSPAAPAVPTEKQGFKAFAEQRPLRTGRGAIQDRILLSFWFLHQVDGKREVNAEDVQRCFRLAGWERPSNLHNHLGTLKRKNEQLEEGSRRGMYVLAPKGRRFAEARFA